jgi:hypothetical protein
MPYDTENAPALLAAAELLLADVKRQREALDRREHDLQEQIAGYRTRLRLNGKSVAQSARDEAPHEDEREYVNLSEISEGPDSYGAISESVVDILHKTGRKMNVAQIAAGLEARQVPIRAKSYTAAVRTAVRRLNDHGRVRRVALGFYRLAKNAETATT